MDAYFAGNHRELENVMAKLRRESPYHSREVYEEINELISYGE